MHRDERARVEEHGHGGSADEVMHLAEARGVDAAIEALGGQETFESCLRVLKPGGMLSSLGVSSDDLRIPLAFHAGLGDCP